VPAAAVGLAVRVSTLVPPAVIVAGENFAVTPVGRLSMPSVAEPVNPLALVSPILHVALDPSFTVTVCGPVS
jgi:hypothetical protein